MPPCLTLLMKENVFEQELPHRIILSNRLQM